VAARPCLAASSSGSRRPKARGATGCHCHCQQPQRQRPPVSVPDVSTHFWHFLRNIQRYGCVCVDVRPRGRARVARGRAETSRCQPSAWPRVCLSAVVECAHTAIPKSTDLVEVLGKPGGATRHRQKGSEPEDKNSKEYALPWFRSARHRGEVQRTGASSVEGRGSDSKRALRVRVREVHDTEGLPVRVSNASSDSVVALTHKPPPKTRDERQ